MNAFPPSSRRDDAHADGKSRRGAWWVRLARCVLLPVSLVAYGTFACNAHRNTWAALDALLLVVCLAMIVRPVTRLRHRWLRMAVLLVLAGGLSVVLLANTVYTRFFGVPLSLDAFQTEWRVSASVVPEALGTLTWFDWTGGACLPLAGAAWAGWRPCQTPRRWRRRFTVPGSIVLAGLLVFGPLIRRDRLWSSRQTPILRLVRDAGLRGVDLLLHKFRAGQRAKRVEAIVGRLDEFFPARQDGFVRSAGGEFPLLQAPDRTAPASAPARSAGGEPPNVVLLVMESVRAREMGAYGAGTSFTPYLDRIAGKSLRYHSYYSNGFCTVRGELALLCSFYPTSLDPTTYAAYPNLRVNSLAAILQQHGYQTLWLTGFNKEYSGQYRFLRRHGFATFVDQKSLPSDLPRLGQAWGKADHAVLDCAVDILGRQKRPFFAEVVTITNHWPWNWPYPTAAGKPRSIGNEAYAGYSGGIYYTDWAVGRFLERARKTAWFDNTIFVITTDHGIRDSRTFPKEWQTDGMRTIEIAHRVPLLIYSPRHIQPAVRHRQGSHVDLAPTILDLLGIRERNAFVGRSLLVEDDPPPRVLFVGPGGEWHLRVGDEYLYAAPAGQPLPPGLTRAEDGSPHVLMKTPHDILQGLPAGGGRPGSEGRRRELVRWADDLLFLCNHLRETDRIYDRKCAVPVDR